MMKWHAMKKFAAIALFGIVSVAFSASSASASWLDGFCCTKKCKITLNCRQYNAFSPFCCEPAHGCCPMQGCMPFAGCNGGACPADACQGAPVIMGETVTPPAAAPAVQSAPPAAAWRSWAPGMMNPSGVPSYYPVLTGNVPGNGIGR